MRRRSRPFLFALALLAGLAPALLAHDLFLKLTDYFVAPNQALRIRVLNGTFTTSENNITRDRLRDLSLVAGGTRMKLDTTAWGTSADRKSSILSVRAATPGTYVVGASTKPRLLALPGKEFTAYLEEEGLTDIIEARRTAGQSADSSREEYQKHVKAIFQVGDARSDDFAKVLGYPAEIVPVENPYALKQGDALQVRCLLDGFPAANVSVLAGGRTATGRRFTEQRVRTDANGVARITLTDGGAWYVKFIGMRRVTGSRINYESKWATLTFAVR